MLEHVVTYNFDAIINAFHREALAMLLPYDSHWDRCHCMHECMDACMHVAMLLPYDPTGVTTNKTRFNAG